MLEAPFDRIGLLPALDKSVLPLFLFISGEELVGNGVAIADAEIQDAFVGGERGGGLDKTRVVRSPSSWNIEDEVSESVSILRFSGFREMR